MNKTEFLAFMQGITNIQVYQSFIGPMRYKKELLTGQDYLDHISIYRMQQVEPKQILEQFHADMNFESCAKN